MKNKSVLMFAFLTSCAVMEPAAEDHASPPPPPPRAAVGTPATRDGEITRVIRTPRGDVDGLLLDDGTVVRVPPHVFGVQAPGVGARVHAQGALIGATLRADALAVARTKVNMAPPTTPPAPPDEAPQLATLDESGTIELIVRNAEGMPDALLLVDGSTIVVGPPLFSAASELRPGVQIRARGEGGRYPDGVAIHARTLDVGGTTYADDGPYAVPPPPPGTPAAPPPPTIAR
jgi:hypothetical protein